MTGIDYLTITTLQFNPLNNRLINFTFVSSHGLGLNMQISGVYEEFV